MYSIGASTDKIVENLVNKVNRDIREAIRNKSDLIEALAKMDGLKDKKFSTS